MSSRDSSRSERELSVHSDSNSKATTSLPSRNGTHVDRPSRPLYSAPRGSLPSRSRSRSPYHAQRGEKRRREEEHERPRHDPRRFDVRYENTRDDDRRRRQRSCEDIENNNQKKSHNRYGNRDDRSHLFKRPRTKSRSRSRSPFRRNRDNSTIMDESRDGQRSAKYDGKDRKREPHVNEKGIVKSSVSEPYKIPTDFQTSRSGAKPTNDQTTSVDINGEISDKYVSRLVNSTGTHNNSRAALASGPVDQAEPEVSAQVLDETALIEERRRRREAIKNKYRGQATPLLVQALHVGSDGGSPRAASTSATPNMRKSESPVPVSPKTPRIPSGPQSPAELSFSRDEDLLNDNAASPVGDEEPSAADYDPTADMQEERARHEKRMFKEDENSTENAEQKVIEQSTGHIDVEIAPKKSPTVIDMFAEDDDDMFAEEPSVQQALPEKKAAQALDVNMMDNWDDPEGYYNTILGELIENRYHVTQNLGRGMFSSVVRATDTTTNDLVAIKIVRNNDTMRKAGIKEIEILKDIAANDPEDKKHIIRLHRSFDHKGHLCMVFENLSLNLREVLKKFGRDIGINLKAIRAYSQQLFLGLSLLRKCQFLHADLKPDNILVNEGRNLLKICDLGSASPTTENITAPYLVSRFYRAPEIILGLPYDTGIDVWSIGCTLFELYTGKILFTGRNNNGMLRSIMDCRGRFPHKLLRKGTLTYQYFDDLLNFQAIDEDRVTGRMTTKMIEIKAKPVRGLRTRLLPKGKKMDDSERKEFELFLDLLDKCLDLRPEKRITPMEALRHPFIMRVK